MGPDWAYETESAVCQSRKYTTSPPAAADSFTPRPAPRRGRALGVVAASLMLVLAGCSAPGQAPAAGDGQPAAIQQQEPGGTTGKDGTPATSGQESSARDDPAAAPSKQQPAVNTTKAPKDAAEQPKPSAPPSREPAPKPEKKAAYDGVAYEARNGTPAAVKRPGATVDEADRLKAEVNRDKGTAAFKDGVRLSVQPGESGTVKSEGPGYFTGASYQAYELTVRNTTDKPLDLRTVVVSLVLDGKDIALPLYGEIPAHDFASILEAGQDAKAVYAFIVPDGTKRAQLHVDLDARHRPVVLDVEVP